MTNVKLYVGIVLVVVGILLIILPLFPVARSTALWDSAFEVHPFGWYYYSNIFQPNTPLHINFEVQGGSLDFIVMDKENYIKYNASQTYEYYTVPYHPSATYADFQWIPPSNKRIYFVWDNMYSLESKFVSAYFSIEYNEPLLPPAVSYIGVFFLIVATEVIIRELRKKGKPKELINDSVNNKVKNEDVSVFCYSLGSFLYASTR